ncbi:MAG: aldo/keto reductase [Chloroflexi bacterium]|nr:aldo/keto reductase [Chloroflexota bacterium]
MIAKMIFGRTGHLSSRVIFGGAAFFTISQEEAEATLDILPQYGVNHIDTAANYGQSELRIGPWLESRRDQYFLATKTEDRTRQAAFDSIKRSLELLHTDHLDLIQIHNLSTQAEWEVALGPGGALEACIEARRLGWARFIGVTGHGVEIPFLHRRALERFDFDTVLFPYNYMMMQNRRYAEGVDALLEVCRQRNVAVQAIKSITRSGWGERAHTRSTWYEPLEAQEDIDRAVHWALGNPALFLNSVGDIHLLPRVLDAAQRFISRPSAQEMQAMAAQARMAPLFP